MATIRVDKFLSNAGYASRRSIKRFLKENEVFLNDKRVKESGERLDLEKDKLKINGKNVKSEPLEYYLLNKPKGIISTSSDEFGRENVTNLIDTNKRVYPVGRLDKDTHGLILLTNDGELTHKLTHPKFHVAKTYELAIDGKISENKIEKLKNGIILNDGITLPAKVNVVKETETHTILHMEIFEGRYRQIRRMCDALFINLVDLERIQFGPIKINNLKEGAYRKLTPKEIELLKEATNKSE